MIDDALKLTVYFGERARAGGRFLADALIDVFDRHDLRTSLVMRGVEGFGARHGLRTDRLLTLSEDLPLVAVAVDGRPRIQAALDDVERLRFHGLVTLERAHLLAAHEAGVEPPWGASAATKLTVYVGRGERTGGRVAFRAVVDLLHEAGIAATTVLLGVDGTADGSRRRARFFSANADVPLMIIAVGDSDRVAGVLPRLTALLERPLLTLERVHVCKRDGRRLGEPHQLPETDPSGLGIFQKLMIHVGEEARHEGRPLHEAIVRALREAGAAGATSLRGVWGHHGGGPPRGDTLWQLGRRVPVLCVAVDTPQRTRQWWDIVDRLTAETGVVTSEAVPAYRATAPGHQRGGLRLAQRLP